MAGFTDGNRTFFSAIVDSVKKIGNLGMAYEDLVMRNSQAVGISEAEFLAKGGIKDEAFLMGLRRADVNTKQYISYFEGLQEQKTLSTRICTESRNRVHIGHYM